MSYPVMLCKHFDSLKLYEHKNEINLKKIIIINQTNLDQSLTWDLSSTQKDQIFQNTNLFFECKNN